MKLPDTIRLAGTAALAASLAFGGANGLRADDAADVAAIEDLWSRYAATVVADDSAAWLTLWDKDGIQLPPGMPARSFAELESQSAAEWAGVDNTAMNIDAKDIVVAGDWAFSRGDFDNTFVIGGEETTIVGKFLTVLKRQPDGAFLIYRDCFNVNGN